MATPSKAKAAIKTAVKKAELMAEKTYASVISDLGYDPEAYEHPDHDEWMAVRNHQQWLADTLHRTLGDEYE